MERFGKMVFLVILFVKFCCCENDPLRYTFPLTDEVVNFDHQQHIQQSDNFENLVITSPDFLNPNSQISFAAPVGAQHPNQKPQPEPQPPPYYRYHHDHTIHINSGIARSCVHYQRTFI